MQAWHDVLSRTSLALPCGSALCTRGIFLTGWETKRLPLIPGGKPLVLLGMRVKIIGKGTLFSVHMCSGIVYDPTPNDVNDDEDADAGGVDVDDANDPDKMSMVMTRRG